MSKKKVLSVVLAASMVASMASVAAVTTSAADVRGTIYFDSTGLGGAAAAKRGVYYCYTWGSVGGELFAWDTKDCRMTNVEGDLYSFDVPSTNSKGEAVTADLIIFHANQGEQTYDTTFSDACFGDTAYVLDELFENPVDSAKTAKGCGWRNNPDQGAHIAITSTGKVQGIGLVAGETAESITDAFIENYTAGMAEGKTGYDNPDLITDAARADYIAKINAIVEANKPADQPTDAPTDAPVDQPTDAPTDAPVDQPTDAPTEVPTAEPTDAPEDEPVETDPYGRYKGLPLPADMNVPAQNSNRDAFMEAGAPEDWDGYYNIYYFEAPEEWITENADKKDEGFEIGFYWFCGGISNAGWPGVAATKLSVLDENGNDIYADSNIYYGFAPSFATNIIWNNGISDAVAENKQFKLQTEDIKVDDPQMNNLLDAAYEVDDTIEGAYVAGCLGYVSEVVQVENGLTGDIMDVYKVQWKYFDPRTGETTTEALKDADGNIVTVADAYWEYEKVAVNPYYDLDYTHVNEAEIPTEAEPATLPPTEAPTQSVTDATTADGNSSSDKKDDTNAGKGTVDTAEHTVVTLLGVVLLAAMGVAVVTRKRREEA